MKKPIWEGVYQTFQDVPACGSGFEEKIWISKSVKKMEAMRDAANRNNALPMVTKNRETILSMVAAMVHGAKGRVKILDFGGGMGFSWFPIVKGIPGKKRIELHIIENEKTCQNGEAFFQGESNIFFHRSMPDADEGDFHIVHLGSSLQYIENWEKLLVNLCRYRPRYFLFTDLPAGDFPSYVTVQNSYSSRIPHWFFNEDQLVHLMEVQGFKLIFRSIYTPEILGNFQPYPQDNFKEELRLGYPLILLFDGRNAK